MACSAAVSYTHLFISEYQAGSPCDIRNFPVISQEKNGRKLKSYKACLDLFSTWKEDKTLQFFVYDQNIQGQYRAYFQKLEEYQIYQIDAFLLFLIYIRKQAD